MSLILNIDTSGETASVCLSSEKKILAFAKNSEVMDHAGWIHPAIRELLHAKNGESYLPDAVSVTSGPGSYTGLRVGLATAKGFCFAKKIPLITVNTLEMLAFSVKQEAVDFIGPMIDARRDEVFMAVYDKNLVVIIPPAPMVLEKASFESVLSEHGILFCGSGSRKLQKILSGRNVQYSDKEADATHLAGLADKYFREQRFVSLAYSEPEYLKPFYSPDGK